MNRSSLVAALSLMGSLAVGGAAVAQPVTLNSGFMPDPRRLAGASGGPVQAMGVQSNCRGYIPVSPQHILISPTGFNFLRVFAESSGDTTLMIRSTSQTWCADDTYGNMPGIDLNGLPPGRYDIYVGSYSAGAVHPYTLSMTELNNVAPNQYGGGGIAPPPPPPPPPTRPVYGGGGSGIGPLMPTLPPIFGRIMFPLRPFSTRQANGRTGGNLPGSSVQGTGTCRGYYLGPPNHLLFLPTPQSFLRVYVLSAADSTLIIRRPDGQVLCSDDRYNFNPGVDGQFPPGMYQIWVGSYRENEARPYRLTITGDPSNEPRL